MSENKKKQTLLRMLPGIDTIMDKVNADPFFKSIPKTVLVQSSRWVVETLRSIILEGDQSVDKADFSDAAHNQRDRRCGSYKSGKIASRF
ncbi:MAG: hypothetical protein JRJ27_20975 [Deltaproteobacteria bacterium]|nr:hypothetical protein [Deltaproteobacteria bacterium]